MKSDDYKVIRVGTQEKAKFLKMAKSLNRSQIDLANQIIDFFERNGIDPKQNFEAISNGNDLKKMRDTFISFLRKQEKDILKPMQTKLADIEVALADGLFGIEPYKIQVQQTQKEPSEIKSVNDEELRKVVLENNKLKHSFELIKKSISETKPGKITLDMDIDNFQKLITW